MTTVPRVGVHNRQMTVMHNQDRLAVQQHEDCNVMCVLYRVTECGEKKESINREVEMTTRLLLQF